MSGEIFLEAREISVDERDGSVNIAIRRSGDLSAPVDVSWEITPATEDGAVPGVDFDGPLSGVVTFESGDSRVVVTVPIIDNDVPDPTRTFVLSITGLSGGSLQAPRTTRVNILDDEDPAPPVDNAELVSAFNVAFDAVVSGFNQPINFEFSPVDPGLFYVASKTGRIAVHDIETGAEVSTFLDIRPMVNTWQDRGLLDFVLHPNFPDEPYVYVFYVVDPPETAGETGNGGPNGAGNRFSYLSRFEADPATNFTTVVAGSEVVLLGGAGQSLADISGGGLVDSSLPSTADPDSPDFTPASDIDPDTGLARENYLKVDSSTHAGGALAFGPDGALYVSVGDGTSFNAVDPRTATVQDLDALAGKILRIDPMTGEGLPDNPFVTEGMDLDSNRAKVFQLGLRNPFSMGFDPDGRLIITETGWNTWEEINVGPPGANFGWPWYEGGDAGVSLKSPYQNLPEAQAFYAAVEAGDIVLTAPFRAFAHAEALPGFAFTAITGGADVYPGGVYPPSLANHYFFSNISDGQIFAINMNDRRDVKFIAEIDARFAPVHYALGPDGHIWWANIATGEIGRMLIESRPFDVTPSGAAVFDALLGEYVLTPDEAFASGLVVSDARFDLTRVTLFDFDVDFGEDPAAGDGIAFVIHADPLGPSTRAGGGFGVGEVRDGVILAFDAGADGEASLTAYTTTGAALSAPVPLPNLGGGDWRQVEIRWEPVDQLLIVDLDGARVAEIELDLQALLGGADAAHFGVGASTGETGNEQRVRWNGVDARSVPAFPTLFRVEAEDMEIVQGFAVAPLDAASGGEILLATDDGEQIARHVFAERAGIYDLSVFHFDENDGVARMEVLLNGVEIDRWDWDQNLGSPNAGPETLTARVIAGIAIRPGDVIELRGVRAGGEDLRTDKLEFAYLDPIPAFRVEAEAFDLIQGFTVATGRPIASGQALIESLSEPEAIAQHVFDARDGIYSITIGYHDQNRGVASMAVLVNGTEIDRWDWDQDLGSNVSPATLVERVISGVTLLAGDVVELRGFRDSGEPVRTDYVDFAFEQRIFDDPPPPPPPPVTFRVEAEDFELVEGFVIADRPMASGGQLIESLSAPEAVARHVFPGDEGVYTLSVGHYDQNRGVASMAVLVNGIEIDRWDWDQDLGSNASPETLAERVITDVALREGDVLELRGFRATGEPVRTDYVDFAFDRPLDDDAPPVAFRVEAEAFALVEGFVIADRPMASGGQLIESLSAPEAVAQHVFSGDEGFYTLSVGYYDQNRGVASMAVFVNGLEIDRWDWDQDLGSNASPETLAERVIEDVALREGDVLELRGFRATGEPVRTDYVDFVFDRPFGDELPPIAFRVEAETFELVEGFTVADRPIASGGGLIESFSAPEAIARHIFAADDGIYDLAVGYYDQNRGVASMAVLLNDLEIDRWDWDEDLGPGVGPATLVERAITNVALREGDVLELRGFRDSGDPVRTDYVDFLFVDDLMIA